MSSARAPSASGASKNVTVASEAADGDWKLLEGVPAGNAAVFRQRDGRVPAEARQRRRQRAEDVCETTGFREWLRLRADDQHTPRRRHYH